MRALLLLVLALAALHAPPASACSVAMPEPWSRLAATGDGALVGNVGSTVGELWLANDSFRPVAHLPPLGAWSISPDGRSVAIERAEMTGGMCETSGHRLERVDVRTAEARVLVDENVGAFAASPRHVAVARPGSDAIELFDVETGEVARRLRLDPADAGADAYGASWQANATRFLAFSASGRLLAAYAGPAMGLVVFDVDSGAAVRPRAPPYGLPSGDDLVALAFSPNESHLAGMTSQAARFSEVFTWDLGAEGNAVVALRRLPEAGRGLAWTQDGLVGVFVDEGWPPGMPTTGILRRWDDAALSGQIDVRRDGVRHSGGIASRDGLLYVATGDEVDVRSARTLERFTPMRGGGVHVTPPEGSTPATPDARHDAPFPLAVTLLGILAASRARRGGRR